jgi:hypothetical protein
MNLIQPGGLIWRYSITNAKSAAMFLSIWFSPRKIKCNAKYADRKRWENRCQALPYPLKAAQAAVPSPAVHTVHAAAGAADIPCLTAFGVSWMTLEITQDTHFSLKSYPRFFQYYLFKFFNEFQHIP